MNRSLLLIAWLTGVTLFISLKFGYFLLACILAKVKKRQVQKSDSFTPFISILIPCYNVGSVIERKIRNILEIDYPRRKFEVIAVESGSTDDTFHKLSKQVYDRKVKVIRQPYRAGKASAINRGLEECRGKIVVLTDADAMVEKGAIKELVKNFSDHTIGAVVGNLTLTPGISVTSRMNHLFYRLFRQKLRIWESKIDSASFWSGELCAFRKSVVQELDEDMIGDDRYILLKTRREGFRCICETSSLVYESDAENILGQIAHKRRMVTGTIQGTLRFKNMLFNPRYGFFGTLIFPLHILRVVILPLLLLVLEVLTPITLWVLWSPNVKLWLAAGTIALAIPALFKPGRKLLLPLLYGFIVQVAILAGIVDYTLKRHTVLWTPIAKP